jgi:hypothetical protein
VGQYDLGTDNQFDIISRFTDTNSQVLLRHCTSVQQAEELV